MGTKSIKAGTLLQCRKVDANGHLKLDVIYTCLGVRDNLIKVITEKGGWELFPEEHFSDWVTTFSGQVQGD